MSAALQTHHIRTTLTQDGTLTLDGLPFQAGEAVEIIINLLCKWARRPPLHLCGGGIAQID